MKLAIMIIKVLTIILFCLRAVYAEPINVKISVETDIYHYAQEILAGNSPIEITNFKGKNSQRDVVEFILVQKALECNAAAIILAHNHPSGIAEPSIADNQITQRLVQALALIDIKVLDHIIVAGSQCYSYAEHGGINVQ